MSTIRESMAIEELRGYVSDPSPLRPLLQSLFLIDNGPDFLSAYYPKAWLEGFREEIELRAGRPLEDLYGKLTVENIGTILSSRSEGNVHGALMTVQNSLADWRKEQGQTPKLFTATVDYFATGEGRTLHFVASRAYSAADFLVGAATKVGGYFSVGMNVFEGLPPESDSAASILLSKNLRDILDGLNEGSLDVHQYFHLNLS